MPNLHKLWQLIILAGMTKPSAYCSRWHNKAMFGRNIIWAYCIAMVKVWHRITDKPWRGFKKLPIKNWLRRKSIWV